MPQPNPQRIIHCRKICAYIFLLILFFSKNYAQQYPVNSSSIGAGSAAMGNTGVTETNVWATFHNQAGLASINHFSVGLYHENRFMMQQLSTSALAVVIPIRNTIFGISAQYFGFALYNETKIGLGLGKNLGNGFSGGIQFDYLSRYVVEQYGSVNHLVAELGMIYSGFEKFRFGLHAFNPYPIAGRYINTFPLPRSIQTGIAYMPQKETLVVTEYAYYSTSGGYFKFGAEHTLKDKICLRIGFIPQTSTYTFGLGYQGGSLDINIAFMNHQVLGISPAFSMEYEKP